MCYGPNKEYLCWTIPADGVEVLSEEELEEHIANIMAVQGLTDD